MRSSRWQLAANVVYTILLIISGALLSLYPDKIKPSFPLSISQMEGVAVLFWIVATLSIVLFFWKEHWANKQTDKIQEEAASERDRYEEQLREYVKELKSMPPRDFLAFSAEAFDACYLHFREAMNHDQDAGDKQEVLERSIRQILRTIVLLAKSFERDFGGQNEYSANIMLYHRVDDLSAADQKVMDSRLVFCDESTTIQGLFAVLDLKADMSTTTSQKGDPDPSLDRAFALPIPKTSQAGTKTRVIAGAPSAARTGRPKAVRETRKLHSLCATEGDFTELVINEIRDYFEGGHGQHIHSFIAVPIFECQDDDGVSGITSEDTESIESDDTFLIGVLNIHSNQTGLLSDDFEPLAEYYLTISPLNVLLVELISEWKLVVPNSVE